MYYQSIDTPSSCGHRTDEEIDYQSPSQGTHEDPELQLGDMTRSAYAEENAQLRLLVRSLRSQVAAARGKPRKYGSVGSFGTLATERSIGSDSEEEDDAVDDRAALVRKDPRSAESLPAPGYEDTTVFQLVRARGGWLCLFMLSLSLTSLVIKRFEEALERDIQLANFLPLLLGHGGNAGGQTVSTVLAALAAGQIHARDGARVVARETLAGLGAGALTAAASVPFLLVVADAHAGITVPVTILVLTGVAACIAAGLPFLVLRLNLDPNVIAAPAMMTVVDVVGLVIYFYIADAVNTVFRLDS